MNCVGGPDGGLQEQIESGWEMAEIDGLRQQLAAAENTILELRHELTETWTRTDGQRTRLEKQREVLRYALKRMWEHYSMAASGRDYLEPRLISCEQQRDTLRARVKELEKENTRLRALESEAIKAVQAEAGGMTVAKFVLRLTSLKRQGDALKKALVREHNFFVSMVKHHKVHRQTGARLQAAMLKERDTLKAELQQAVAHNHDLEDAIAMGEHTVEVLEGRVKELEEELAAFAAKANLNLDSALTDEAKALAERDTLRRELATARGQLQRHRELARWIERDMMTPARNTCHVPWDALEELVALANGTGEVPRPDAECECGHTWEQHEDGIGCCLDGPDNGPDCRCKEFILGEDVTELARSKRTTVSGGIQQIDTHGTGEVKGDG